MSAGAAQIRHTLQACHDRMRRFGHPLPILWPGADEPAIGHPLSVILATGPICHLSSLWLRLPPAQPQLPGGNCGFDKSDQLAEGVSLAGWADAGQLAPTRRPANMRAAGPTQVGTGASRTAKIAAVCAGGFGRGSHGAS